MSQLRKEQLLSRLHFFIFGATIVGENAVSALVVATFGSGILGKLIFVNSLILFTLPLFFFQKIDQANRGKLLKRVLKYAPFLIGTLFAIYIISEFIYGSSGKFVLLLLYPISYLLKTILFLTFWIIAADVSEPSETKSLFPRVASVGFLGGLIGALLAALLLSFLRAEFLILFWALIYIAAYIFVKHIVEAYNDKLIPKEFIPTSGNRRLSSLLADTGIVFKNVLVRYIAILHYGIFISIFLVDFHFWHNCNSIFHNANSLTLFQNTYYILHSILTILILHYVTPDLIATRGFTRIFSYLPITLFVGSVIYATAITLFGANRYTFTLLLLWQIFRYITFENFFSPIYQMFFAAVEKEKRGRAKTVIEGLVKPLAMMSASVIIMLIGTHTNSVSFIVGGISLLLVFAAMKIKHAYMQSLVQGSGSDDDDMTSLIANIGSESEKECFTILEEFALFSSIDMKRVAIKILVRLRRAEATSMLYTLLIENNNTELTREAARYAGEIVHDSRGVVEFLATHQDPVVWHRAILSLIHYNSHLVEFREKMFTYFRNHDEHDQVIAGIYLWKKGSKDDRKWIAELIKKQLSHSDIERRELGIIASVILRLDHWQELGVSSLLDISTDSRKIVIRAIIDDGTEKMLYSLISIISLNNSSSTEDILLREIDRQPEKCVEAINHFVRDSRALRIFCHKLIKAVGSLRLGSNKKDHFELDGISEFAYQRLAEAYTWAGAYHLYEKSNLVDSKTPSSELMEIALHERLEVAAEIALDTLVLFDETGFIAEGRRELRIADDQERVAIVELLETSKDSILKDLTIPILEKFNWDVYYEIAAERIGGAFSLSSLFRSNNVFLQMTGVFWCSSIGVDKSSSLGLVTEIRNLVTTPNKNVNSMAEALVSSWEKKMSVESGTFQILNRVLFLKKNELFAPVAAARLVRLAEGLTEIEYNDGDLISREGDRANHLYLMREGSADIVSGAGDNEVKFAEMNKGDAYGEVGLFNQDIRSASVKATSYCRVFVLSRSYLIKMVSQMPELANTFLTIFGRKLQESHNEVIRLQQSKNSLDNV